MINTEKSLIGSLLLDTESIEKIYTMVTSEMFVDRDLGRIYGEIKTSYDEDKPIDIILLSNKLSDIRGITELLVECLEGTATSLYIVDYATMIRNDYRARYLTEVLKKVSPNGQNVNQVLSDLQTKLDTLSADTKDTSKTLKELSDEFKGKRFVEDRKQGIKTGIHSLDKIIQGMDNGDLILIAARPAVGKTAFATQIALNTSKTHCTALISLEMTNEQLYDRIMANMSGIELNRIRRSYNIPEQEYRMFENANEASAEQNLILSDDLTTVSEMYVFLKRHKCELAVIDYAQLIRPEDGRYKGNRYAEVGEISHRLKQMAKKLDIPIVLLTQLNRVKVETSEPTMAEIRESGDFEQDASVIILLWNKTEDRTQKGVQVDKNRNGETGKIELYFDGKVMQFREFKEVGDTPFG